MLLFWTSFAAASEPPTSCPGSPRNPQAKLSVHLVCEGTAPGCRTVPDQTKTDIRIRSEVLMGMTVRRARVEEDQGQDHIAIELDDSGVCWFHKTTAENVRKQVAILYQNTVLIDPVIHEPIVNGKLWLVLGQDKSRLDYVTLCQSLDPTCPGLGWWKRLLEFFQ